MLLIYDPDSVARGEGEVVPSTRFRMSLAEKLGDKLRRDRRNSKRDPNIICVINRRSGDHRWQSIAPNYEGSLANLENLYNGEWRIATYAEEDVARTKDFHAAEAVNQERRDAAIQQTLLMGKTLISAVNSATEKNSEKKMENKK